MSTRHVMSVEILNCKSHTYPTLWDIVSLMIDFPMIRCAVMDDNIFNYLCNLEMIRDIYNGGEDEFQKYVKKNSTEVDKDFLYVWNENLCPNYLKYITMDWFTCFLFTEKQDYIDERNWLFSYCCYDGSVVEISSPQIKVVDVVKNNFETRDVEMNNNTRQFYKEEVVKIF